MLEKSCAAHWKVDIMTDNNRDFELEQALRGAFDENVRLSDEASARILANLTAAEAQAQAEGQAQAQPEAQAQAAAFDQPRMQVIPGAPAPRKKRPAAWKIAVPVAACLLLVAIGVGVGTNLLGSNAEMPVAETKAASEDTMAGSANSYAPDGGLAYETDEAYETFDTLDEGAPMEDFNTEEYAAIEENGFVSTVTRPLSTCSADVDTASYCNLRRMINDGYSLDEIPDGAVRIEEMLNYFHYDSGEPEGNDLFAVRAESARCPWNDQTQLLVMTFTASDKAQTASKGSNLVFLIDISGSMDEPDKLDLLKDSFGTLLENLGPNDRVSIVTYAAGEDVLLEGASGDDTRKIMRALNRLEADGSTNGEAGLEMAYEVAERNYIEGGVNRIVMASDGDLNVGITSESDLYDFVEEKRETGVYLSVLGFGSGNYKDTKMETLADHGNGTYHYIDCVEEAERVLGEDLTANFVPVADDVKLQVEFNPAQVKAYRLIGYENRAMADEDFLNEAADAAEVGAGAQFTVAYELVLADSDYDVADVPDLKYGSGEAAGDSSTDEWLTCSMRYKAVDDDKAVRSQDLVVGADSQTESPSDDWVFASSVIEFGMIASDSEFAEGLDTGDVLDQLDTIRLNDERQGFYDLVEIAW